MRVSSWMNSPCPRRWPDVLERGSSPPRSCSLMTLLETLDQAAAEGNCPSLHINLVLEGLAHDLEVGRGRDEMSDDFLIWHRSFCQSLSDDDLLNRRLLCIQNEVGLLAPS